MSALARLLDGEVSLAEWEAFADWVLATGRRPYFSAPTRATPWLWLRRDKRDEHGPHVLPERLFLALPKLSLYSRTDLADYREGRSSLYGYYQTEWAAYAALFIAWTDVDRPGGLL